MLLGTLGYQLNLGTVGDRLSSHLLEKNILSQIETDPDNPDLYSLLGNIYYSAKNWADTQDAWEKSLMLNPDNALILNNLAWHYATCEDESFQDHYRALALAKLAIRLEKSPHIWDTLAESYYVNGMFHDAIDAGEQALERAGRKRSYYEDQLDKFEKALGQ
jgi:cytochrome c-type biogenesis protein CcmH/NrfG